MSSATISGVSPQERALVETEFGQLAGKHQGHVPEEEEQGEGGKERSVSS